MPTEQPCFLRSERELREHLPAPSERIVRKIRTRLEATGRAWIASATLAGLAVRRRDGFVDVVARAMASGLAQAPDDHRIRVCDDRAARVGEAAPSLAAHGFAGAIFLNPGVESTLRVNGPATASAAGDAIELQVAESYVHCPKAFRRSALWSAPPPPGRLGSLEPETGDSLGPGSRSLLAHASFALLGTCLENGHADVSPRGDPPGFLHAVDDRTLVVPDRPGNRIADSFRNLLAHPVAGLLVMIPGVDAVLRITGRAHPIADPAWLAPLAVQGRAPRLGIWLRVHEAVLERAPALAAARLRDPAARREAKALPSAGRALVEQVEPEARFRAARGRLVDWMLERDARRNLY